MEASQDHSCRDALFYGGLMDIFMNQGHRNEVATAELMIKMVTAHAVQLMADKPDGSDDAKAFEWQVAMNATLRDGVQARDELHVAMMANMAHRLQTA